MPNKMTTRKVFCLTIEHSDRCVTYPVKGHFNSRQDAIDASSLVKLHPNEFVTIGQRTIRCTKADATRFPKVTRQM